MAMNIFKWFGSILNYDVHVAHKHTRHDTTRTRTNKLPSLNICRITNASSKIIANRQFGWVFMRFLVGNRVVYADQMIFSACESHIQTKTNKVISTFMDANDNMIPGYHQLILSTLRVQFTSLQYDHTRNGQIIIIL